MPTPITISSIVMGITTASVLVIPSVANNNGRRKRSFQPSSIAQQRLQQQPSIVMCHLCHSRWVDDVVDDVAKMPLPPTSPLKISSVATDVIHKVPRCGGWIGSIDNKNTPKDNLELLYHVLLLAIAIPGVTPPELASQILTDVKLVDGLEHEMEGKLKYAIIMSLLYVTFWIQQVPRCGGWIGTIVKNAPKDNLMLLYVVLHSVIAIPGTMAAELTSQILADVKLVDGGLEHMVAELMYSTMGGLVVMIFLIRYRNMRVITAIAAGGLVLTYSVVKHLLKESYQRFKFRRGGGVVQSAVSIILVILMLHNTGISFLNAETAAKLFCIVSMVPSTIGLVSPTVGFMWYGLPKKTSSGIVFASVFRWYNVFQFMFGATGLLLLNDKSIETATGMASILGTLAMAEQIFMGNLVTGKTKELSMVGLAILALISLGLFLS